MRNRACRRLLCNGLVALAWLWGAAHAQLTVNSPPNIVGSGARALGMGGAFIGLADDATAASWNPGGLTQLERPEVSFVYGWRHTTEDFESPWQEGVEGRYALSLDKINYLSAVYPIAEPLGGRNLVFSVSYQRKFNFERRLDYGIRDIQPVVGRLSGIVSNFHRVKYRQNGRLGTLTPAVAYELTDKLSAGLAVNLWDSRLVPGNEWNERAEVRTRGILAGGVGDQRIPVNNTSLGVLSFERDYEDVRGTNYAFGLLYKPNYRIGVGAVYHTHFSLDVDYTETVRGRRPYTFRRTGRKLRYDFPKAMGLGVSYRFPGDKLTVSADVTRRDWDEFVQIDERGGVALLPNLRRTSPITGLKTNEGRVKPTYAVRLGAEYVFIDPAQPRQDYLPSLRAGLFYDPEPSSGRTTTPFGLTRGDGEPDDFYGVALGGGVLIKDRVNVDVAYVARWGTNVRVDAFANTPAGWGTSADVLRQQVFLSTVIYF